MVDREGNFPYNCLSQHTKENEMQATMLMLADTAGENGYVDESCVMLVSAHVVSLRNGPVVQGVEEEEKSTFVKMVDGTEHHVLSGMNIIAEALRLDWE
jgi:hypothetical protein